MNIKVFCYRTVLFMLLEIFIYFLVAVLFYTTSILVLQMILVFVAGTRLHALGILMHEGVHWHISENLKLNDLITNCLAGYWIFLPVQNYRTAHFAHHNHPFSKGDYDWQNKVKENNWHFPMSWKKFMFFLASGLFYQWRLYPYRCKTFFLDMKSQWGSRFFIIIFLLLVFYFPSYVFFLWLVPILIITPVLTRLRTIGEHFALDEVRCSALMARDFHPKFWEKILIFPYNVSLHKTHHQYPHLPFYDLSSAIETKEILKKQFFGLKKTAVMASILALKSRS